MNQVPEMLYCEIIINRGVLIFVDFMVQATEREDSSINADATNDTIEND
jgi:hypothetical protein